MGLFDDLNRLKPPHGCECGLCACNVAAKYEIDREEEKLHQFLIGIDDDKYAAVGTNLLSQQPPATLDRAYQAFLQEERSRDIANGKAQKEKDDVHIFALPNDWWSNSSAHRIDKSKLSCSHCKRTGHDNSGCFVLHGYPPWWLEKYGKKGGSSSAGQSPAHQPMSAAPAARTPAAPTTPAPWCPVPPYPVGLPDGAQAVATKEGSVVLADGIILRHDQLSGSLIGGGERIDGLYYVRQLPTGCTVSIPKLSAFELWHRRMGHPSDRVVKLVPANIANSGRKKLNKACDICPQAKQSRDHFPNSHNRATRIFEMIHYDLWGSYKTPSTCGAHYFLTLVDDFSRGV
ncbi:uncharacterized protein LOC110712251 [Chenopodium quinoa]|uniref:uncharacterized protein LOC110712251 n=1 Tax=Chenopodium quinoa TaxID=63459 RepID=UPI000B799A8D|nr:uncharacterized protein LOC110712251 [Chenopodium quinoa]